MLDLVVELISQLLHLVCDFLCFQLDWLEALLCHDVRVVGRLHSSGHAELEHSRVLSTVVHHTDLVVSVVKPSEVVSQLSVVFLYNC